MSKLLISPIKIQGKKTKLIEEINSSININLNDVIYVEPFLGSGEVLLNLQPKKAILNDINPHIINFLNDIKTKKINSVMVKNYLTLEGNKLKNQGELYWYAKNAMNSIKTRTHYYFYFLNRSCFNGLLRFNKQGQFLILLFAKKLIAFLSHLLPK